MVLRLALTMVVMGGAGIVAVMLGMPTVPGMLFVRRCLSHRFMARIADGAQHRRSHCTANRQQHCKHEQQPDAQDFHGEHPKPCHYDKVKPHYGA